MDNQEKLYSRSSSPCHEVPCVIVRSRSGGFVTQNCEKCETPHPVQLSDLPELRCKQCQVVLEPFINGLKNYAYRCSGCNREWEVASLVHSWSELFEYHGFAIPHVEITF
jgi:hypothetical protein